jgi:hypothetical protein
MIFEIILGIVLIYGLYFYFHGKKTLPDDVRKNWPPQDIEDYQLERNQEKYFGQIILCIVTIYFMVILV